MNTVNENSASVNDLSNLSVHKNRRSLILLITVFILPIVLAKLALNNQWLDLGVTNQGKLLTQPLTLAELDLDDHAFTKQWLIIYLPPTDCLQVCQQNIETVHNSYVALGKDMPRVTAVLLSAKSFTPEQNSRLNKSQWFIQQASPQTATLLEENQVVIADPLGNIILRHKPPQQAEQQAAFGKGIIADMKKLLKYSKVG